MKQHDKPKKKTRKRLNIARTLVFFLCIYIIVCCCYYVLKKPIKGYEITGNEILKDVDIIRYLHLENYPSFLKINIFSLEKRLEHHDLIKEADVKYGWNFRLKVNIEENSPIFITKSENQICLKDGTKIPYESEFTGIPTLLNYTPEKIEKELALNLSKIEKGILYSISEIEYRPSYSDDGKVIDEYRFLLSMNDNNLVYITSKNAEILNKYLDIIATYKLTSNGTLYLDGNESGNLFIPFS